MRQQPLNKAAVQLAAILEASPDAIIGTTSEGLVETWSRGAQRIYGYTDAEMMGRSQSLLWPPERAGEAERIHFAVAQGERLDPLETVHLTKTGRTVEVRLSISPIIGPEGTMTGALTVARDLTEHQEAQSALQELQTRAQHRALILETANRVALDILSNRAGIEALRHIADAARILAGARYAALGVANTDGVGLSEFITVGLTPQQEAAIGPLPVGHGVLGLLLNRTEPLRVDVLSEHPASVGFPPHHPPMDSFLGVPIRRGDTVLGSLYLTNKQGEKSFTLADEVAVQALGAHAAVAIHNLHMLSRQRALVSGLIAAQEEERRAVAYDLHDGLTQFVMAAHAHLETFKRARATGREEKAAREIEQGLKYLKEAVIESRRLVNGLRSLALDDLGLAGALEQLVNEEKTRAGWEQADLVHNIAGHRFDKSLETGAYRVAQEALTNARKHAETTRVQVRLLAESGGHDTLILRLEVRDWGKGFVPEERIGEHGRVGLQGMIERVHLLGGTYQLHSSPGAGARVCAVFPILEPQPEEAATS